MIPRSWRWGALLVLLATSLGFLATRLVFVPVPWPDGSAFYLPALDLVHWPSQWRMHAQAAFVPSYDQANFNLMPALPFLLGVAARSGLLNLFNPELLIRIMSLPALLAWAWLLWKWLAESLEPGQDATTPPSRNVLVAASVIAAAGLWDPVLRWGTLVVRTETWIGMCWIWILREMHRWETSGDNPTAWNRIAWRISGGLALAAYFHFEAAYFIPAAIVGLGFSQGWFKRLIGIGVRTTLLLSPWILYVALHAGLFAEQMQIQFFRLAHGNHWMQNAYMIFHSLFIDHGSPSGWPKFFNVGKGVFWLGLAGLASMSVIVAATPGGRTQPRRALLASTVAFACCFYLWATKAEVWFITLIHLVYWPWMGAALILIWQGLWQRQGAPLARRVVSGLAGAYAVISLAACVAQAYAIAPSYTWSVYQSWVDCIETSLGPLAAKPALKLWQPHVPDVLVELSARHPDWDLTRTLDFPSRRPLALEAGRHMDAILFTRLFNPSAHEPRADYAGPLREPDRIKMAEEVDLPFAPWAMNELPVEEPGRWEIKVCATGPFWGAVSVRKQ